jgi:hypothetical protein
MGAGKGGGMYNESSSPVLTNVTISGNSVTGGEAYGGGLYNYSNSSPVLINASVSGNSVTASGNYGNGGGMYNDSSSPKLINASVSGNSVTANGANGNGGGIYNGGYSSSPVLMINVSVSGNAAKNEGGAMYNITGSSAVPEIRNSIIWGNTAGAAPNIKNNSGSPNIQYSIVEGSGGSDSWNSAAGTDGGNNLDPGPGSVNSPFAGWQDPSAVGWTATTGGDYRLNNNTSPAVNAGYNDLYPDDADDTSPDIGTSGLPSEVKAAISAALEKDLGGENRKKGTIDMGAYEF